MKRSVLEKGAKDETLTEGDYVQARWGKTWISAKVLETRWASAGTSVGNRNQEVKVRFQGHDKDHDRWIPFPSSRIRPQIILRRFIGKDRRGAGCFTRPGDRVRIMQVDRESSSCFLARGIGMPGIVVRGRPDWDATYVRALTLLSDKDVEASGGGQGVECEAGPGPLPPSPTRLLEANDTWEGKKGDIETAKSVADFASVLSEASIGGAKESIMGISFGDAWKERQEEEGEGEEDISIDRPLRKGELVGVYWNAHVERVDEEDFAIMIKEVKALRNEIERVAAFAAEIRKS